MSTHTRISYYVFIYIFAYLSYTHTRICIFYINVYMSHIYLIIVAVIEDSVREEQFLHDMCLLGAVTVEITQILTRAGLCIYLYLRIIITRRKYI